MTDAEIRKNISENLTRYMEKNNVNNRELADVLGVSESTVGKWILQKNAPRMGAIEQIARYFKIEKSDLIDKPRLDVYSLPGIHRVENLITVPILGHIQCGMPTLSECNYEGYFKLDPELCKADFSLVADGDSMIDANIHEGDIVFFKETPDVESGTIAAVLLDDQTTLKKVIKMDNMLILQPANDKYKPILIKDGDYGNIMILGKMVGVFSKRDK